jgi:glyoxylase-like metal-dependent hydrolase (beta-lactamase superfamily II)
MDLLSEPLGDGLHRATFPLPFGPRHVHAYLIEDDDGWTIVDTGLALPDTAARWTAVLASLGRPEIRRIVITHFHPDHLGAAGPLADLTGAPVWEAAGDAAQAELVYVEQPPLEPYLVLHGMPPDLAAAGGGAAAYGGMVELAPATRSFAEGESFEAGGTTWRFVRFAGHADWQHGLLDERDGRLLCGDHLLDTVTPTIGLYPNGSQDPLGDYLAALDRVRTLAPAVAHAGHGEPMTDPAGRAAEIDGHHAERLRDHMVVLDAGRATGWAVALELFGDALAPVDARLALTEALAHLARLELAGAVRRLDGEPVRWEAA